MDEEIQTQAEKGRANRLIRYWFPNQLFLRNLGSFRQFGIL